MDRNFALLGLSEDATKEQVKVAYARQIQKYKAADYDDDPEYVRKKTAELKRAYEAAYRRASGQEPAAELRLPSAHEKERRRRRAADRIDDADSMDADRIDDADSVDYADRVDHGKAERLPKKRKYATQGDRKKFSVQVLSGVITVLVLLLSVITTHCAVSDDYDYDYSGDSAYSYDYKTDADWEIFYMARETEASIWDLAYGENWIWDEDDDEAALEQAGEEFVNRYLRNLDGDNLDEICDDLYMNYGEFPANSSDTCWYQLKEILGFYGFMSPDDAAGRIDSYTGETITDMTDYLNYLNRYYDDHFS